MPIKKLIRYYTIFSPKKFVVCSVEIVWNRNSSINQNVAANLKLTLLRPRLKFVLNEMQTSKT